MNWWKNRKCKTCGKGMSKGFEAPSIRLQTVEGVFEFDICNSCANFFEGSAEVLINKNKKDNND